MIGIQTTNVVEKMNIEQLFAVSHNTEIEKHQIE